MEAAAPHDHDYAIQRTHPSGGTLADVLDRILDKGLVIDAWVQVSLLGLELLTIEARVVVASIETYLKYADAIAGAKLSARPPAAEAPAPEPAAVPAPEPAAVPAPAGLPAPSEDAVVGYLARRARGAGLDAMAEHFGVARAQLEDTVNRLLEQEQVRRDERRDVLLYQGPRPRGGGPRRFSFRPWSNR